jgi:NAD(P)H-flavin reductase
MEAELVSRRDDSRNIFTLDLVLTDAQLNKIYAFQPGQFNMIYLYGIGEVAISIVSDPRESNLLSHTIRAVGRITDALKSLKIGDRLGIRGPFGRGWPMKEAAGKDVVVITGGLGCAPSVSIIEYILKRRERFGQLNILQGVKHSDDFIFHQRYEQWRKSPDTHVFIAADEAGSKWPWQIGYVTNMINKTQFDPKNSIAMMCGPEAMMGNAVQLLASKGMPESCIYLSMERNMECGMGLCGHCQFGGKFICKDGPVFAYPEIKALFHEKGF